MTCLSALHGSAVTTRPSQVRFMATVVDHFDDTGEWPTVPLVQNALAEHHDRSDAKREAGRLSGPLGRREGKSNRVVLTFRGIRKSQPNHRLVDGFERALGVLSGRYRRRGDRHTEATVTVGDLTESLCLSERRVRCILSLLEIERLVSTSPTGGDSFVITPEMHHFLYVRGGREYLKVKARRDRQRCRARKRRAISDATIRDRKGLREVVIGILVVLLAAFMLWVGARLWPTDSPAEPPPGAAEARADIPAGPTPPARGGRR